MKLYAHLENVKDLKSKGYKVDNKDYSGAQAITSKWEKDVDGRKSTKFNKSLNRTLDKRAWIDLPTDLAMLFSEVASRKIILMINKAAKMYGYGATMFPIPLEMDYSVEYNKEDNNLQAHITSSSYNTIKPQPNRNEEQENLVLEYQQKLKLFNFLLGNIDAHKGNIVTHANKKRLYAIDFGLAFSSDFKNKYSREVERYIESIKIKLKGKNQELKKKKIANFITFVDSFVENNKSVMRSVLEQTYKEIAKKVEASVLDSKADKKTQDNIVAILNMLKKIVYKKIETLDTNIEAIREACQKILKYIEEL